MFFNRRLIGCGCCFLFIAIAAILLYYFLHWRPITFDYLSTTLEPNTLNTKNNPSLTQTFRITNNNFVPMDTSSYNFIMEASPALGQSKTLLTYSQSGVTEDATNRINGAILLMPSQLMTPFVSFNHFKNSFLSSVPQ